MPLRILLIDDDDLVRQVLQERLVQDGHEVHSAATGRSGLEQLRTNVFDAALLDIHLGDMTGIEILETMRRIDPGIDAIIMTGYPQMETAIQALRLGAYDYLTKPIEWVALRHVLERMVERRYLREEVSNLRNRLAESPKIGELVGTSQPMQQLRDLIGRVAPSDSAVLIEGESGTGKELVAFALHRLSGRSKGPFIPVNCAAIPAELLEGELFGHVKGAFSGATADSRGLFRSANGGTLFLDEIGDLLPQMQPKLLRVLQEREVRPIGSSQIQHVDIRLVTATNQGLETAVKTGKFRQDLFFRLNVVRIETPPLRTIREDIAPLAMSFVRKLNKRFGRRVVGMDPDALASLTGYDFPGNVRELDNLIERAYALGADGTITLSDLPALSPHRSTAGSSSPPGAGRSLDDLERDLISETLRTHNDDKSKTAEALGMSERTLYRRLKKQGLV